jgi:glucosyl-dolichyl phosphate glucuronosyltransferase
MLSVIVATYNRAGNLKDTLDALKCQELTGDQSLEILVVDNNSKDETEQVVMAVAEQSPWPIHYFLELKQGVSHARNRGIAEARGEFLIFTDDDVIPASQWVQSLWSAASKHRVDLVGGPIFPIWSKSPPHWLLEPDFQKHLALLNRGNRPILREHVDPSFLFGTNIAFRKEIFEELGGFQTDLGERPDNPARGEDAEMIQRVMKAGKMAVYEPSAVVYHRIPRERMHVRQLRRNLFSAGKAYIKYSKKWNRIPLWLVRECLSYGSKALWFYGSRALERGIDAEAHFWYQLGMIRELFGLSRKHA